MSGVDLVRCEQSAGATTLTITTKRRAYMTPGEFRAIIEAAGVKQGEAAERLGVSRPTVVRWLAGIIPINSSKAKLVRAVFKVMK